MMRSDQAFGTNKRIQSRAVTARSSGVSGRLLQRFPRQVIIGLILVVALFAFEIFNFDTTRFALSSLLGDVSFMRLRWATILAIAFCAIDFAGLAHMFTPEKGLDEPREVWYLMGAWLLGATMNAVMTWWAVSLTLLSHPFGNEVLAREQLLVAVPIFVAVLVWLTRILFIGAISVAGDRLFQGDGKGAVTSQDRSQPSASAGRAMTDRGDVNRPAPRVTPRPAPTTLGRPIPAPMRATPANPATRSASFAGDHATGSPGAPGAPGAEPRGEAPTSGRVSGRSRSSGRSVQVEMPGRCVPAAFYAAARGRRV